MKAFFQDKFEYNHSCNQRLVEVLNCNAFLYKEKIKILASHTLNAHHIWNHRIMGVSPTLSVWEELEIDKINDIDLENFEQSIQIINLEQWDENMFYTNSSGQAFTNTVADILFHIVNHSTYHRGQLVTLLKNEGILPLVTDYIFYKR